jgi:hypothetical protein
MVGTGIFKEEIAKIAEIGMAADFRGKPQIRKRV